MLKMFQRLILTLSLLFVFEQSTKDVYSIETSTAEQIITELSNDFDDDPSDYITLNHPVKTVFILVYNAFSPENTISKSFHSPFSIIRAPPLFS